MDTGHFEINLFSLGTDATGGLVGVLPGLEVDYGARPGLQLHLIVPQGYAGSSLAPGDVELGAKLRFLLPGDDDLYPQAAIFPTVETPVGSQRLGFNTGHPQIYLPIWLQKGHGAWTLYGGGGYWINPGLANRNYGFFGVALLRALTAKLNAGVELFHQTSNAVAVRANTGFNAGATYDFSATWHFLASVGTGLQHAGSTNRLSYYAAVQWTF